MNVNVVEDEVEEEEGDTKKEVEEVEGEEGDTKKEVEVELVECAAKISKTVVMKENATSVRKSSRRKTRKWCEKTKKKNRRAEHLSEEDQTQIALIKSQIDALKPGLKEIKNLIREKKEALKDDQKQAIHAKLKVEIQDLKAAKETKRNEIVCLRQKIRDMKYQN